MIILSSIILVFILLDRKSVDSLKVKADHKRDSAIAKLAPKDSAKVKAHVVKVEAKKAAVEAKIEAKKAAIKAKHEARKAEKPEIKAPEAAE